MVNSVNGTHSKGQNPAVNNDRKSTGAPRRSHTNSGRSGNNNKDVDNGGSASPNKPIYKIGGNTMQTIATLRSNGISHPSQQVTLTCYIPPYRVGAVIGRRGATILHIQREAAKQSRGHSSAVRVSVMGSHVTLDHSNNLHINNNDGNTNTGNTSNSQNNANNEEKKNVESNADEWTPVVIRGDPCGAFAAAKLLVPLLSTGSTSGDENNSDVMDDVVLDIPIHRSRHAAIIGRKGLTIATISADHNVRIMVPHRVSANEDTSNKQIHVVQLEGQLDQVIECCAHMLSIVCSNSSQTSYSSTHTNNSVSQNGSSDNKSETASSNEVNSNDNSPSSNAKPKKFIESSITVPGNVNLSLTRIKQIGKSTNTVIRRRKKNVSNDTSSETNNQQQIMELTLTGRTECVTRATGQLERIIANSSSYTSKSTETQSEDSHDVDKSIIAEGSENQDHVETPPQNDQDDIDNSSEKDDANSKKIKASESGNNGNAVSAGRKPSSFNKRRNTRGGAGRGNFSNNSDPDSMNSKPKHTSNVKRGFGSRNNKRGGRGSDLANGGRGESSTAKKSFDSTPTNPNVPTASS